MEQGAVENVQVGRCLLHPERDAMVVAVLEPLEQRKMA